MVILMKLKHTHSLNCSYNLYYTSHFKSVSCICFSFKLFFFFLNPWVSHITFRFMLSSCLRLSLWARFLACNENGAERVLTLVIIIIAMQNVKPYLIITYFNKILLILYSNLWQELDILYYMVCITVRRLHTSFLL